MPKKTPDEKPDPLAAEIDALLKDLPNADPTLQGEKPPPKEGWKPIQGETGPRAAIPDPQPRATYRVVTLQQRLGVWGRVALGVALAALVVEWPYAADCGWPLAGYGAAVVAIVVAGIWGEVFAWKYRMAAAHVFALLVVLWGLGMTAGVILPPDWLCAGRRDVAVRGGRAGAGTAGSYPGRASPLIGEALGLRIRTTRESWW